MARYGIHSEWKDGTFETEPSSTYATKREALRVARFVAKGVTASSDIARILVCDKELTTVATFNPPKH